jgi:cholesterol transport system auxiliary component
MMRLLVLPCAAGAGNPKQWGGGGVQPTAEPGPPPPSASPPPPPLRRGGHRRAASFRTAPARVVGALTVLALGGCITVLPKTTPVQLYRFGSPATAGPASPAPAPDGAARGVVLAEVRLPPGAAGDGLLTIDGDQAAYVGGARWLEPASLLFREDVAAGFAARSKGVMLLDPSQTAAASGVLRLEVTSFETRYAAGPGAAPSVVVRMRATLAGPGGRPLLAREFSAERPAGADRVSAIVTAYDAAVGQVVGELVDWTGASVHTPALEPPPKATP